MTPEIITPQFETTQTEQFQCRHIFTDGRRCGSPAIRGPEGADAFCYFHHNSRRPIQDAPTRKRRQSRFNLPNPEDRSAIQQSIGEVLRRIASNEIDPRRAGLLLYGLQIASLNLPKSNPSEPPAEIVSEVTHDPEHGLLAPPAELGANQPKGSAQRLLEELGFDDDEPEISYQPAAATIDLQASMDQKVYTESTTPAQTVRLTRPSKSHRPANSFERIDALKVRSHEPRSTHHSRPVHPGRAPAAGSALSLSGAPAAPDLRGRSSGRPR